MKHEGDGVLTYEMHFLPDVLYPAIPVKELDIIEKHLK